MDCRKQKSFNFLLSILAVILFAIIFGSMLCIFSCTTPNTVHAEEITSPPTATQTIYWGIDDSSKKLIISSEDKDITGLSKSGVVDSNGKNGQGEVGWRVYENEINSVEVRAGITPTSVDDWFFRLSNCTVIDLSGLNTSQVTNMSYMFAHCYKLTSLNFNVSLFDTSNVIDMSRMFSNCIGLTSLDISKFNTSKVINMSSMFLGCSELTALDLSSFNTAQVTDMSSMFEDMENLISLNISRFDTSNVTNMGDMFRSCASLSDFDLSNFDTSNVTEMGGMFRKCTSLSSLDLTMFDTASAVSMEGMFRNCTNLQSLDLSSFKIKDTVNNVRNILSACDSLSTLICPSEILTEFELPFVFWDGTGDITSVSNEQASKTIKSHITHALLSIEEKDATCEENGHIAYEKCEICNAVFINSVEKSEEDVLILAHGHDYSTEFTVDSEPTCTEAGSKSKHCSRCDDKSEVTEIPKLGHEYGEWSVKTDATCMENGSKERICSHDSSHVETQTIPAHGHDYSTDFTVDSEPTCTEAGSKSKHCSHCDEKSEVTEIPALGHAFGEWIVQKEATTGDEGEEYRVCSHDSKHIETKIIPKLQSVEQTDPVLLAFLIILAIVVAGEVIYLVYRAVKKHIEAEVEE